MANGEEGPLGYWAELILSILVDIIGLFSYFIPVGGEATDLVTAPINIAWIMEMYNDLDGEDGPWGDILAGLGGLEELAPLIDIIPSATIAWALKWYYFK